MDKAVGGKTTAMEQSLKIGDIIELKDLLELILNNVYSGIIFCDGEARILNPCPFCHEKQEDINRLKDEIICLKDRLRHRERTQKEGFFGS